MDVFGRTRPVDLMLGGVDLLGVRRLAFLGRRGAQPVAQRIDQQVRAGVHQSGAQLGGRLLGADLQTSARVHRPGVEPLLQLHEAYPGLGVAGEDRPFQRRGSAPPGQQREVHVDHRQGIQHVGLDETPEGHDHAQLGA